MSGFKIGEIVTQKGEIPLGESTEVSIVDAGISIYRYEAFFMGGGLGTYTPAQARELGALLINAADRWTELNAQVQQSKAEIKAAEHTAATRLKDLLA